MLHFTGQPDYLGICQSSTQRPARIAGQNGHYREHSKDSGGILQDAGGGFTVETTQPIDRPPAADCDGVVERTDEPQPSGDR